MLGEVKGRWIRELTESELKLFVARKDLMVIEWEIQGLTFFGNRPLMQIIRTNAMGADVRIVHGGWQYSNDIAFLMDWTEIRYVGSESSGRKN